ncbi:hypothetical protein [Spongiactinospora sp. TRM90649]|uniref:hypothetical protein n=1 Tax=Spongiactinospora sp. TRM90649 TaxID=3031114 RepID=UPI0023F9B6D9|nr:hypothetical protein [Spongiactinospora sp. TRM90649]MDF5757919.1 hypothetical protein [Spongiactinospora sp. TRM90649]
MRRLIARIATAMTILAAPVLPGAAHAAGGWAATTLDPVPARFTAGTTYTLGFWLLQHGSHPYWGDEKSLGRVALRFIPQGGGRTLTFDGVRLSEPAHYAAAVALPAGDYRVEGQQGWFQAHPIGTLKVPGALSVDPPSVEARRAIAALKVDYWEEIRPPGIPVRARKAKAGPDGDVIVPGPVAGPSETPAGTPAALAAVPASTPEAVASVAVVNDPVPWWRTPYPLLAGVLLAGAAAALVLRSRAGRATTGSG